MSVASLGDMEVVLGRPASAAEQALIPVLLAKAEEMIAAVHPAAVAEAEHDDNRLRAIISSETAMVYAALILGDTTTRARINDWRFTHSG